MPRPREAVATPLYELSASEDEEYSDGEWEIKRIIEVDFDYSGKKK